MQSDEFKFQQIFKEYQPKLQNARKQKARNNDARAKKQEKISVLRTEREEKIKGIMTAAQYQQFETIREEKRYGELNYKNNNNNRRNKNNNE